MVFGDAICALLPGETTLNAASTLAANGELELWLVIVAGAIGAIAGDSVISGAITTAAIAAVIVMVPRPGGSDAPRRIVDCTLMAVIGCASLLPPDRRDGQWPTCSAT
jgi:hypothetical protein